MSAPALRDLQTLFWDAIATAPGCVRAAPALLQVVAGDARLAPQERLAIYAGMYWSRILDVLRQDFARTAELLDEDVFTASARAYIAARPSRHPSIARVGEAFADFLSRRPGIPPVACDLARLEWAQIAAFDAADAAPLRLADLAALPVAQWAKLRLTTVPSLALLELRWPVQDLLVPGAAPPDAPAPSVLRVWRRGHRVFHATVDATEAAALGLVRAGASFGEIAEQCGDAAEAAALLARWLEDELLARASLRDDRSTLPYAAG